MAKVSRYQESGFFLLSQLETSGLHIWEAAAVTIAKGDFLHDDTTGYATNATTDFADTALGVANAPVVNAAGSKGDLDVEVIPLSRHYQFIVPVGNDALISKTNIGNAYDLSAVGTIDIADATGAANAPGFFVDDIDVSADAVAVTTYGYAIGHFVPHTA